MNAIPKLLSLALVLWMHASAAGTPAGAHPAESIVIGQSVELSGLSVAKENVLGAKAYFGWINAQGGVFGKSIELVTYDDGRDTKRTIANTERLLKQDKALALFGYRSTPTVEAILPLLAQERVALIAPFSGGRALYRQHNPYIFNLRAGYDDEIARMVAVISELRVERVAVLHQDDTFGMDALAAFEEHFVKRHITPVAVVSYNRKSFDAEATAASIVRARPQTVLMACSPSACVDVIKRVRKSGLAPQFLSLSNVNSAEFFRDLGADGRGVGIMQVMPYPGDLGAAIVREFRRVLKETGSPAPLSYAALEGFAAAKLTVHALRRAGPNPTRASLLAAMESLQEFDLGGVVVRYSPGRHESSRFVELVVIGKNGALWR